MAFLSYNSLPRVIITVIFFDKGSLGTIIVGFAIVAHQEQL
jgi:hypothetical protein